MGLGKSSNRWAEKIEKIAQAEAKEYLSVIGEGGGGLHMRGGCTYISGWELWGVVTSYCIYVCHGVSMCMFYILIYSFFLFLTENWLILYSD